MKLENPFKRVLSGILATAMTLSMIPPPQVEASSGVGSTSNYLNAGSAPSGYSNPGTSGDTSYLDDSTNGSRYSIKVSLMWAPRADDWTIHNQLYDWSTDKVKYVIDGMFLYENDFPKYGNNTYAYPGYWSDGSALGYLTDIYPTGYQDVHRLQAFHSFQYMVKTDTEDWFINQSSTAWYDLTKDWGIDGAAAQSYVSHPEGIPNVFYELEAWRSRIFNVDWDTSLVDANNQLTSDPKWEAFEDQSYLDGKADWIKENWAGYHNVTSSPGAYFTGKTAGLVLPKDIFIANGAVQSSVYNRSDNDGYQITDNIERAKAYYTSPYFINLVGFQMQKASSTDYNRETFYNPDIAWTGLNAETLLQGILQVSNGAYDGEGNRLFDNIYGEYKIVVEPITNRKYDKIQGAYSYKDMVMMPTYTAGPWSTHAINTGITVDASQVYTQLANGFQVTDADNGLNINTEGGTTVTDANRKDLYNKFGLWVFTFPAVPVELNDPAPTIIKTYVEVDYFDESGKAVYKEVYPTTEATVLQTTGYGEHNDTTFYAPDSTLTQGHNIHAWEEIAQLDEDGVETGVQLRAYLNDVLVVSPNVLSDPEQTVWVTTDLPQNFNVVGDTESTDFSTQLKATAENITSYHFDLLMGSTSIKGVVTDKLELESQLNALASKYGEGHTILPLRWTDGVRYSDNAMSVSKSEQPLTITGANFLEAEQLADLKLGYSLVHCHI